MHSKTTTNGSNPQALVHQLPAGILSGDKSTELFACRETKRVFGISEGKTIAFADICPDKRTQLFERLLSDPIAMMDLGGLSPEKRLEKYAFCVFGALDHDPDFCKSGKLKDGDNFLCSGSCACLEWKSKSIKLDGNILKAWQVRMIQYIAVGYPDKEIAGLMEISISTLNTHKAQLFALANVTSSRALILRATEQKIIQ
ncbi:LuxR C-terminal-related transcriptional regulator [Flavobacterium sp.]|uniref:helix-turn-helix transcriptional regulator n=1 Tax=Flavobacterium sp. TaxID=239 RepID=UPI001207F352|nr:LuxR C-terminal-related transcriptional regulator [Flavobacterium sp.]RZJ71104.1 MAG: DNA-binding response regulator [Flavobacterium sp.]